MHVGEDQRMKDIIQELSDISRVKTRRAGRPAHDRVIAWTSEGGRHPSLQQLRQQTQKTAGAVDNSRGQQPSP
jgi:hypothetical protein